MTDGGASVVLYLIGVLEQSTTYIFFFPVWVFQDSAVNNIDNEGSGSKTDDAVNKLGIRGSESKPNTLAMPPLAFGEKFGDVYEVILILDNREQFATQG